MPTRSELRTLVCKARAALEATTSLKNGIAEILVTYPLRSSFRIAAERCYELADMQVTKHRQVATTDPQPAEQ